MFSTRSVKTAFSIAALAMATAIFGPAGAAHAVTEQEPNNIRDQANGPVMDGDVWTGVRSEPVGEDSDTDYLKFYLARRGTVTFDVSRSVNTGPNALFSIINADNTDSFAFVNLGDGETSGQVSDTLDPGKYVLYIGSAFGSDAIGMHWQVTAHGDFATWAEIQAGCSAGKAKLPKLTMSVAAARKNLAKAKKKKGKARAKAVKKAKSGLARAQKALNAAKSASEAACAIEQ